MFNHRLHTVCAVPIVLVVAAGCVMFASYPRRMASVRRQFVSGRAGSAADEVMRGRGLGRDPLCQLLERGMMLHGAGRYGPSSRAFLDAERVIGEFDDRAVVSARDTVSNVMTLVVNEKAVPYRGEGFERVLLNSYLALNYLMVGDLTGARVEVRKAYQRQQDEARRHERALDAARSRAASSSIDLDRGMREVRREYASSSRAAARVKNAYQNAFTYYISSVVYELGGEINDAYIDCKHAIELRPDATCVRRDLVRYAERLGFRDELAVWRKRFGDMDVPPEAHGSVLIVFEQGMMPAKEEVKLPIPTEFGILFMAFPAYRVRAGQGPAMDVSLDGTLIGRTQIMADIEGMAVRNLDDKLPVLFVKQMVRTTAKGVAAKQVYDEDRGAGIALSTLGTLVSEQADLRGWITLPRDIQVSRMWVRPGCRSVALDVAGAPLSHSGHVQVRVASAKTTVVNARYTGEHMYVSVSKPLG